MKTGISNYSFGKLMGGGGFGLFDAIDCAAKTGYDCIEFTDLTPPAGTDIYAFAKTVRERAETAGISISAYISGADFINGSGGDISAETERVKKNVDVAVALGTDKMRHDTAWGFMDGSARNYMDAIEMIAPVILEITKYAESRGVKTMSENHGHMMQDGARMEALVRAVNHKNYGLLVDIGNFMCADEDCAVAVATTAPYAFHVHAKDFLYRPGTLEDPGEGWFKTRAGNYLRGTILGHGTVPARQCLGILAAAGFDGTVGLEFEGLEDNMTAVRLGYEALKKITG